NAPIGSSLIQIAVALQSGCPVIVKPSPWAAHSFNVVVDALDAAWVPPGLVQVVHGGADVGRALVESKFTKAVCFTGSVPAGLLIAQTSARTLTPFILELGGSNPFIVLPDADLDLAVESLLQSLTYLNGQYCCGAGRVAVHESVHDAFIEKAVARFGRLRVGDALEA
ncbi:Aldehyde/histidinol dehydrogenase, partial [Blyttiomyces helicus]